MPKKPASKNMARLNSDMRRELTEIISGMKDPRVQSGLLSVTRVETAPDLSTAKVYISVLGQESSAAEAVAALDRAKGHVRSEVASRMHIRRAPEFTFVEDGNAAYADHINSLLKDLD